MYENSNIFQYHIMVAYRVLGENLPRILMLLATGNE
jgi:hypothetical protein